MPGEKIRLGGMALANGVLVHGPTAWACAVRARDGSVTVVAEPKRFLAAGVQQPLLRGPARLLEALAVLPALRRRLPEARLPFERPAVLVAMLGSAVGARVLRNSSRLSPFARELVGAVLSFAPAALAVRSSALAGYHGAEHISIGSYEHDELRAKEHERCGSHMIGPLLGASAVAGALAARAPSRMRNGARLVGQVAALGVATEIFLWMTKHPDHPLSRALARPGHQLQQRLATREPTPDQLEVADAALAACLELEHGATATN